MVYTINLFDLPPDYAIIFYINLVCNAGILLYAIYKRFNFSNLIKIELNLKNILGALIAVSIILFYAYIILWLANVSLLVVYQIAHTAQADKAYEYMSWVTIPLGYYFMHWLIGKAEPRENELFNVPKDPLQRRKFDNVAKIIVYPFGSFIVSLTVLFIYLILRAHIKF